MVPQTPRAEAVRHGQVAVHIQEAAGRSLVVVLHIQVAVVVQVEVHSLAGAVRVSPSLRVLSSLLVSGPGAPEAGKW